MGTSRTGRLFLFCCGVSLALALGLLLYPLYVIRPFRAQGPRELLVALAVIRFRAIGLAACVLWCMAAAVWYWRRERRKVRRFFSALGVATVALCALLSRVNVYELMFHPSERSTFSPAAQAKLDGGEMVIAVTLSGSARAYPVRSISYHHIVNDTLGGVPIAATY
jgi:Protein of unknown function (DUF3179)